MGKIDNLPTSGRHISPYIITVRSVWHITSIFAYSISDLIRCPSRASHVGYNDVEGDSSSTHILFVACYAVLMSFFTLFLFPAYYFGIVPSWVQLETGADNSSVPVCPSMAPQLGGYMSHRQWIETRKQLLATYRIVQRISFVFLPWVFGQFPRCCHQRLTSSHSLNNTISKHSDRLPLAIWKFDMISKPDITLALVLSFGLCLNSAVTSTLFLRQGHALRSELMERFWMRVCTFVISHEFSRWYIFLGQSPQDHKGIRVVEFWTCLTIPLSSLLW